MAERLTLLVLQEFADWDTGRNARPGRDAIAEAAAVSARTVDRALTRGIELGLIERTANAWRHRAAEYRLVSFADSAPGVAHQRVDGAPGVAHQRVDGAPGVAHQRVDGAPGVAHQRVDGAPSGAPLVTDWRATGGAPQYQDHRDHKEIGLRELGTSPDGPITLRDNDAWMGEGPEPVKSKPRVMDVGYGPRCARHGYRRVAPADCPECDAAIPRQADGRASASAP